MLPALLDWFKLDYGPFWQSNQYVLYTRFLIRPARKELHIKFGYSEKATRFFSNFVAFSEYPNSTKS